MKKTATLILSAALVCSLLFSVYVNANEEYGVSDYVETPAWAQESVSADTQTLDFGGKSVILVEETTGKVLYERDADIKMPPASITKIMTLLLTMEAMENGKFSLDTLVTCSTHAASMGGAQIWLREGEQMSVNDLLKAVCIKSANDAAVALAELVGGSEEAFVDMMNERAKELGMTSTVFKNASGLDAEGHFSTARDIAAMSRALMRHDKIFEYTKIWMDTLRNGATELVNTNKLIRFYKGATGLKTGTTNGAGSCLSATAERDGLSLIGVVMGYENSDSRNAAARKLLDYGFANWKIITPELSQAIPETAAVKKGIADTVKIGTDMIPKVLVNKNEINSITDEINIETEIDAPIKKGQSIGKIKIFASGKETAEFDVRALEDVPLMTFGWIFVNLLKNIF